MEDILAAIVTLGLVVLVVTLAVMFNKRHKKLIAEEHEAMLKRKKEIDEYLIEKRKSYVNKPIAPKKIETSIPPRGREMTRKYNDHSTPTATSSTQSSDDDLLTGMLIGAAINSSLHSSSSSSSDSWSSSSSSSSDSWSSSSSSSSDSWSSSSSSSSDSWSSSDSSPSSDW